MLRNVVVGLAGISFRAFWGFTEAQYKGRIDELRKTIEAFGATLVVIPETFKDSDGGIRASEKLSEEADIVILDVETYPEGSASFAFFDHLSKPLMLWGRSEQEHGSNIGHNSFCGVNFLAGNLALRGQRFRKLYGAPDSKLFRNRLQTAIQLIWAAKESKGSKIGLFGNGVVPKFYDIDVQTGDREKLLKRWDIDFVGVETQDLVKLAASFSNDDIRSEVEKIGASFHKIEVSTTDVEKQARLLRAFKEISNGHNFSAVAIRCWPELQELYSIWPCPSLSILNDDSLPAACEGDAGGALDMLLASKLAKTPSTLLDIVDWNDADNVFSIWHCGPTASSWADESGTVFKHHNVDGRTESGRAMFGCAGIIDMQFKTGPVTLFRTLGAIDDEFVVQGDIVPPGKERICGSFGQVGSAKMYGQNMNNEQLRNQILDRCLPHHFTAVRENLC